MFDGRRQVIGFGLLVVGESPEIAIGGWCSCNGEALLVFFDVGITFVPANGTPI